MLRTHSVPDNTITLETENIINGHVISGSWRREEQLEGLQRIGGREQEEARVVRDSFCAYFNEEGAVSWQERMIGL